MVEPAYTHNVLIPCSLWTWVLRKGPEQRWEENCKVKVPQRDVEYNTHLAIGSGKASEESKYWTMKETEGIRGKKKYEVIL